jgi:type IV pilus assembly protein PilE
MDRNRFQGFSLLELLIALAIVAILATITVPSFSGLLDRSRRSDAMSALLLVQLAQERWRSRNISYAQSLEALGWASPASSEGYYQLRVSYADAAGYRVLALPKDVQRRDSCGIFAVNAAGPDFSEGYAGPACWNR